MACVIAASAGVRSPRWTLVAGIRVYAPAFFQLQVHSASPIAPAPQHYIQSNREWVEKARVSICFFRVCYLWLVDMDVWRKELNAGLAQAFHDDDECEDFEEQLFLQMLSVVEDEVEREPLHRSKCGGSKSKREYVFRDREHHHDLLYRDYFSERPTFGAVKFRRRFRMRRDLFVRIMDGVSSYDPWFLRKWDALGQLGVSTLQNCFAAIRMLAYGVATDV